MTNLPIGGNQQLTQHAFTLTHNLAEPIDVSIFLLDATAKIAVDEDMIFYGLPTSPCAGVKIVNQTIEFNLDKIPSRIEKLAITATLESVASWGKNTALSTAQFNCVVDTLDRPEKALILLELYKRNEQWKVRFVAQGFNGGLAPLAEHFGVELEKPSTNDAQPTPAKPSAENGVATSTTSSASAKVNLSKISLTKAQPKVDLTKRAGTLGLIKANLNWTQASGGFFSSAIDLDLGAFVELNNGQKALVQALGKRLEFTPYVELLADDRTGKSVDGEWLHINGDKIQDVKRIIIFAFIYEGSPNWEKANAQVTIHVPDMAPIESKLTEKSKSKRFCAIAEIKVTNGNVQVEQLNKLFDGHKDCDQHFGWGFTWTEGRK
ncbi:TerD family protein [Psychromonas sp. SR45-3]|uniref:TerD family protein n=1 Tax=Psychromonas sp. SR45-3 TaxID=2760930 RepID=UPI0015F9EC28|nr:TerD family protein [Psychromonas sp. SR45-3]MBB1273207.1 TerD family protein [Psychromonas sp. SR45-3]